MARLAQPVPDRDVPLDDVPKQLLQHAGVALAQEGGEAALVQEGRQ